MCSYKHEALSQPIFRGPADDIYTPPGRSRCLEESLAVLRKENDILKQRIEELEIMITDLEASLTTQIYSQTSELPVTPQVYCSADQVPPDVSDQVQNKESSSVLSTKLMDGGKRTMGISQHRSFPSWRYQTP